MASIVDKLDDGNLVVCQGDRCYTTQHFHICGSSTVAAEQAAEDDLLLFAVLEDAFLAQESAAVCSKTSGAAPRHMRALSSAMKTLTPTASLAHHDMHINAAETFSGGAPSLSMRRDAIGCAKFWGA